MEFPRLAARTAERPLLIVGGLPVKQKLVRLREHGVQAEWVDAYHDASQSIRSVEATVRRGGASGLMLLNKLMGHKTSTPLVGCCRQNGLEFVFGGKGGIGELMAACRDLERRLEQQEG